MNATLWRRIAGFAMLALLALVTVALIPPYYENYQFQQWLDEAAAKPQPPEALQAAVVDRAAQLGLPVRAGDVRVKRTGDGQQVDIIYVVRVDLPLYTVDLHFHPAAGTP